MRKLDEKDAKQHLSWQLGGHPLLLIYLFPYMYIIFSASQCFWKMRLNVHFDYLKWWDKKNDNNKSYRVTEGLKFCKICHSCPFLISSLFSLQQSFLWCGFVLLGQILQCAFIPWTSCGTLAVVREIFMLTSEQVFSTKAWQQGFCLLPSLIIETCSSSIGIHSFFKFLLK